MISELRITNFKCFKEEFILPLNKGINILVGNNEAGKTTILEAINLVLTGLYQGKPIKHDLSQYLFNYESVKEYIYSLDSEHKLCPPSIIIELFFEDESYPEFMGNYNSKDNNSSSGLKLEIFFDEKYNEEYDILLKKGLKTLPLEFYDIRWITFAREYILPRYIPIKSAFIDSSNFKTRNNTDLLLSKIIKDNFEDSEIVGLTQAFRQLQEDFIEHNAVKSINNKISSSNDLSNKKINLGIDLSSRYAWEDYLIPYLDRIPFTFIGKGEQAMIKTQLSLSDKLADKASIILIEEPENHLSHTHLNKLLKIIKERCDNKQIIITTHNSYVANKLNLNNLILLSNNKQYRINSLTPETIQYFEKLPGFDTLRLILCNSSILVEGASDELIVQKAYMRIHNNHLPIEDGIDVISINNLSFLRLLEISKAMGLKTIVITDNDGDIDNLRKKYKDYLEVSNIHICYDKQIDNRFLLEGEKFNFNTLEPILLRDNSLNLLNKIFNKKFKDDISLLKFMNGNKVDCALKIFNYEYEDFKFPQYIIEAITKCDEAIKK